MSDESNDMLGAEPDEERLAETGRLLGSERPVPSPGFRGELGRLLRAVMLVRPISRLRAKALCLAVAGALLLGLAAAGVAGSGPLAPSRSSATPASSSPSR